MEVKGKTNKHNVFEELVAFIIKLIRYKQERR